MIEDHSSHGTCTGYALLQVILMDKMGWQWNKSSTSTEACSICLKPLQERFTLITHCNHEYHEQCILRIAAKADPKKRLCLLCRHSLTAK